VAARTKIQLTIASESTATQSSFLERQIFCRDLNALAVRVTDPELVDSRDVYHQAGRAILHARRRLFAMDRAKSISGRLGHLFGPSQLVMLDRNDESVILGNPAGGKRFAQFLPIVCWFSSKSATHWLSLQKPAENSLKPWHHRA
jgi:hypothetical protein